MLRTCVWLPRSGLTCSSECIDFLIIVAKPFLPCSSCGVEYVEYPSSLNMSLLSGCSFMRVSWRKIMSMWSSLIEFKVVLIFSLAPLQFQCTIFRELVWVVL